MKRSVSIFGWSTIAISAFFIISELLNLATGDTVDQLAGLAGAFAQPQGNLLEPLTDMFTFNRYWSLYSIAYFAATLTGGVLFVRFREIGRRVLEIACWTGVLNACIETVANYVFWKSMETSMRSFAGSIALPLDPLNPIGVGAIAGSFLLWVIPSIGIGVYLRNPSLRSLMIPRGGTANDPTPH